eukprot:TRINITY_DN10436_c0_g1_i2.p1 TRINITY_DN10436_c0_g1~~TRINITY_DN10436_c0_g1_i2.p1  ORF type:complete len:478 (+),score=100.50 TRINITY_DN10436_c0_g1_i2:131-1564(+)
MAMSWLGGAKQAPRQVPRDWFTELFGFKETASEVRKNLSFNEETRTVTSSVNGMTYKAGKFLTPSLEQLRKDVHNEDVAGQLRLSHAYGDVSLLQANEENRYAVFQVASQFNCLEFVGPACTPEMGVTGYVHDQTQGPCCSVSCGPATVYRNYFHPFYRVKKLDDEKEEKELVQTGQSSAIQINNLDEIEQLLDNKTHKYFRQKNGYVDAAVESLRNLNKRLEEPGLEDSVKEKLKVGVQLDSQVTSSNWGRTQLRNDDHLITQVFCSAISISYSRCSQRSWERFARIILDATYEATFLAALQNAIFHEFQHASNVLYLTLIGGGVFGNEINWIAHSIRNCCLKFKDTNLDVRIVSYGQPDHEVVDLVSSFAKESLRRPDIPLGAGAIINAQVANAHQDGVQAVQDGAHAADAPQDGVQAADALQVHAAEALQAQAADALQVHAAEALQAQAADAVHQDGVQAAHPEDVELQAGNLQ